MEPVTIRIREDGPLVVTGTVVVTDHDGNVIDCSDQSGRARPNIALCRCGLSATKPLCDGTHRGNFDGTLAGS